MSVTRVAKTVSEEYITFMPNDIFLYNGPMSRGLDLDFINYVSEKQSTEESVGLLLVTDGGSADAAFKIGRYLQSRYKHVTVIVPGLCKSARTLVAIAGHELAFTPYGELGPLDVQMAKEDKLSGLESGLNTSEAFLMIEDRARQTFHRMVAETIGTTNGVVTYKTAADCANGLVSALYGPLFGAIDPEEVGARTRAMRIGKEYAIRLAELSQNCRTNSIEILAESYPDHGFVIDFVEAQALFNNVRAATSEEMSIIQDLGDEARFQQPGVIFKKLSSSAVTLASEPANTGKQSNKSDPDAA